MIKKRFVNRVKRSIIWKLPLEKLKELVKSSSSLSEILRKFQLENKGGNYKTLKRRLIIENIDFSHIKMGMNSNIGRKFSNSLMTKEECLKEMFVENSTYARTSIRRYLKRYELIPYKCECGIVNEWHGHPISLQLDHKNGVDDNNELENLRWMCPNCHSQTHTFAGRNKLTDFEHKEFHCSLV